MELLIIVVVLIASGYLAKAFAELKHYRSIKMREREFLHLPAVTFKNAVTKNTPIENIQLVSGSVVISVDYFKRFAAGLSNLFGIEMWPYEALIDRARREAVLRMKAMTNGADIIVGLHIETSSLGKSTDRRNNIGSIEATAYGTALTLMK